MVSNGLAFSFCQDLLVFVLWALYDCVRVQLGLGFSYSSILLVCVSLSLRPFELIAFFACILVKQRAVTFHALVFSEYAQI